jgi:hypothetical protein
MENGEEEEPPAALDGPESHAEREKEPQNSAAQMAADG